MLRRGDMLDYRRTMTREWGSEEMEVVNATISLGSEGESLRKS